MWKKVMCLYPLPQVRISGSNIPNHLGYHPEIPEFYVNAMARRKQKEDVKEMYGGNKTQTTQTMYRETQVQTEPYEADYTVPEECTSLKLLTLNWLNIKQSSEIGENEIKTIEIEEQRTVWARYLPEPIDVKSCKLRNMLMTVIEASRFAEREEDIEMLNELRLELAKKLIHEEVSDVKRKIDEKMKKYSEKKMVEKEEKLRKIRSDHDRKIRKIEAVYKKQERKYRKWNIIDEHVDRTSELYGPQMMFGENPKRKHEEIKQMKELNQIEMLNVKMNQLVGKTKPKFDYVKHSQPKKYSRASNWSEEYLRKLHDQLKSYRLRKEKLKEELKLRQLIPRLPGREEGSFMVVTEKEEIRYQAAVLLQKSIRGRAIQTVMFEGRVNCQEMIEEIKKVKALRKEEEIIKAAERRKIFDVKIQEQIEQDKENKKNEIIRKMEGMTLADMIDFLAKEIARLHDEQAIHSMAIIAEQERNKKEASEAGRRQEEEQRRRELEEMFRQMMKEHQNTVDLHLEDIVAESSEWAAERLARKQVRCKAKMVDLLAHDTLLRDERMEDYEIIADLMHNFALPEVKKNFIRSLLAYKHSNYLQSVHDLVYGQIEEICSGSRESNGLLKSLPKPVIHVLSRKVAMSRLGLHRMKSADPGPSEGLFDYGEGDQYQSDSDLESRSYE